MDVAIYEGFFASSFLTCLFSVNVVYLMFVKIFINVGSKTPLGENTRKARRKQMAPRSRRRVWRPRGQHLQQEDLHRSATPGFDMSKLSNTLLDRQHWFHGISRTIQNFLWPFFRRRNLLGSFLWETSLISFVLCRGYFVNTRQAGVDSNWIRITVQML